MGKKHIKDKGKHHQKIQKAGACFIGGVSGSMHYFIDGYQTILHCNEEARNNKDLLDQSFEKLLILYGCCLVLAGHHSLYEVIYVIQAHGYFQQIKALEEYPSYLDLLSHLFDMLSRQGLYDMENHIGWKLLQPKPNDRQIPEPINHAQINNRQLLEQLRSEIEVSINAYIQYSERHCKYSFIHRHGNSGILRAQFFIGRIQKMNQLSELSGILQDFARQRGEMYQLARGNINLNNHSCMTYIIQTIDSFYQKHKETMPSYLATYFKKIFENTNGNRREIFNRIRG